MRHWRRGGLTLGLGGTPARGMRRRHRLHRLHDRDHDRRGGANGGRQPVRRPRTRHQLGNSRARVRISWSAKNAQGADIGSSSAEFEVAGFSNFDFSNTVLNSQGQPSSSVFTNNLSGAAIADIHRDNLDVDAI
jgi:hypothetical protein